ncbi:MAG: alpha/beta hydrolase [Gammaproteobacteria bacterium]|nr:MAG: alpha/beta hydrolase [Gammaproteobacteria bacterium]
MRPLVFVHGYLGGSAQWEGQAKAFASRFNVITPDLPGFGRNHAMQAPEEIGAFADYVLEQVRDQGVDRFDLVGHSMGGMIVQEMVTRAPERIDRLVLYGTGPVGLLPGRFETIGESKRRVVADGVEACGRRISATWFVDYEQAPNYPVCANLAVLASQQAALAGLSAMEKWSGEAALANVRSPTLVLWGDCDRTYTWEQQQRLWWGIAGARLAVIPGCAHAVHLEKPDLFNAMLADFLESGD